MSKQIRTTMSKDWREVRKQREVDEDRVAEIKDEMAQQLLAYEMKRWKGLLDRLAKDD